MVAMEKVKNLRKTTTHSSDADGLQTGYSDLSLVKGNIIYAALKLANIVEEVVVVVTQ